MADLVDIKYISKGPRYATARLTNISDGTGESLVKKIDISGLTLGPGPVVPTNLSVKEIQWSIQGFTSVRLFWDHTTPDLIDVMAAGNGYLEYGMLGMLSDPGTAGGTGSILLTTAGAVSDATYDITIVLTMS